MMKDCKPSFARIDSITNGRPLNKVSDNSKDANALTPNHLLLLKSNECFPPGNFVKSDGYSRRKWRQVQYLADKFWRRWTREYLPILLPKDCYNERLLIWRLYTSKYEYVRTDCLHRQGYTIPTFLPTFIRFDVRQC